MVYLLLSKAKNNVPFHLRINTFTPVQAYKYICMHLPVYTPFSCYLLIMYFHSNVSDLINVTISVFPVILTSFVGNKNRKYLKPICLYYQPSYTCSLKLLSHFPENNSLFSLLVYHLKSKRPFSKVDQNMWENNPPLFF